jgi:endonuclease-3
LRTKSDVTTILDALDKYIPNPKSDLEYTNAYTLLVAIVLSAQSTDKGVNKATKALFEVADTPQKMLDLGIDNLKEYIKTIGLYNNKAKSIMSLSQDLIDKFGGNVPSAREEIQSLAGAGRKTANVVLNVWFNQPTLAVDTHVARVANRLGFSDQKDPTKIEFDLENIIPDEYKLKAHHLLILFGRYTCKSVKPLCEQCPITALCHSKDKRI